MKRNMNDDEIVDRHGKYGTNYTQITKLTKKVTNMIKKNGIRVKKIIERLRKKDVLNVVKTKKHSDVVSIRQKRSEVEQYLMSREW